jgi:hypothetical protein
MTSCSVILDSPSFVIRVITPSWVKERNRREKNSAAVLMCGTFSSYIRTTKEYNFKIPKKITLDRLLSTGPICTEN